MSFLPCNPHPVHFISEDIEQGLYGMDTVEEETSVDRIHVHRSGPDHLLDLSHRIHLIADVKGGMTVGNGGVGSNRRTAFPGQSQESFPFVHPVAEGFVNECRDACFHKGFGRPEMVFGMTVIHDQRIDPAHHLSRILDYGRNAPFFRSVPGILVGFAPDIQHLHSREFLLHIEQPAITYGVGVLCPDDPDPQGFHIL